MSGYQFTPQAEADLFEIWSYIAVENVEAANRVEEAVHSGPHACLVLEFDSSPIRWSRNSRYTACALLMETPLAGRIREDLTALPVRFWLVQPLRNCWIVYFPDAKPLQVIRILHSARNVGSLLR
jgi:plasmid stabilization system protein ParE